MVDPRLSPSGPDILITTDNVENLSTVVGATVTDALDTLGAAIPSPAAQFVVGAADASLPNARVAADSTEVDADLTTPNVISWALKLASVAFSKLADLTALSVLGRASSTSGVMAAITATAGSQRLVSNAAFTTLEWASDLSTQFDDTVTGTLDPYLLPATFRSGDSLVWVITGNVILNRMRLSDNSIPPDGFVVLLSLRDQSGGSAPGFAINIVDTGAVSTDGSFRPPGQVQGSSPGPDYIMRSEEEGCIIVIRAGNWRLVGGTAAQAITGDVTVAAGNGGTRDSQITAGSIVNADVNASAAIATSKLGALTGEVTKASGSTATVIASNVVDPDNLAVVVANIGAMFAIRVAFVAGGGGAPDDVTIFSANAPFAFRILKTLPYISTLIALSTIQLRSATGGGGTALSSLFASAVATEDPAITTSITATTTVAANGSVFIRRSDSGVAGEIVMLCVKI